MITLLIVDDEQTTRESLRDFLPWEELGVGRVATAVNGLAALDWAQENRPHIVLTDVRMPKMDGIELSRRLRERWPDCKILFISGYTDKEYLKSAISVQALDYIEKPLNIEEIQSSIRASVALIRQEEQRRDEERDIRNRASRGRPDACQRLTQQLVRDGTAPEDLFPLGALNVLYQNPLAPVAVCCAVLNWPPELAGGQRSAARARLLDAVFTAGEPDGPLTLPFVAGFIEDDRLALLADAGESASCAHALLAVLLAQSNEGFTVSVGVAVADGLAKVPEAYRTADAAAGLQFYDGPGQAFPHPPQSKAKAVPGRQLYAAFRQALRAGDHCTANALLQNHTAAVRALRTGDIRSVRNTYFELLLLILEVARERGQIVNAEEDERRYAWQEMDRIPFLAELDGYLANNLQTLLPPVRKDPVQNRKIVEINRYIQENYANSNLSVQAIARHFFLNHQYICSLYKKATGKTLNDAISEVRIERSQELLQDARYRVNDVAAKVGFADSNYFSTLFRRHTGCTPSEYRERNRA